MASPSDQLRAAFAHAVDDARQEEFLSWLADVDALVREIAPPFDLLDCEDPGWCEVWLQDNSAREAIDYLRAIDFAFETQWLEWSGENGKAQS